jgi:UDP-N-acetylglucosamine 1-carboxyvinyltransferase
LAADLRARAAPVLAGTAAEGTAHMEGVSHVDRGYEKRNHKLHLLGASIQRLPCLPSDSQVASSGCINSEIAVLPSDWTM